MSGELNLQNLNFGFSDAGTELIEYPKLLRLGYYDLNGVEGKLDRGHQFLILGYKGAGKSMVAARFKILAQDTPTFYSCGDPVTVRELPLADFRKIVPDSFDAQARAHWSWMLFLCVKLLEGLENDGQATADALERAREALRVLRSHQIISKSPRSLQKFKTTKMVTTIRIPKFADQTWEFDQSTSDQTLNVWIAFMKTVLSAHESRRKHFLFIDGLDDLGPIRDNSSTLLGGLISATKSLNQEMRSNGSPCKVVVCCRTDLYERLDVGLKGKIRSDFAIELDWYQDPRDVASTHLVQLVQQRARASGSTSRDFFHTFFPARLDNQPTVQFLGQNTRHTPRDFLSIIRNIQPFSGVQRPLTRDQVLSGLRQYSRVYFRDEVDDALDSYFGNIEKNDVLNALGRIRTTSFTKRDFLRHYSGKNGHDALEALFECSFVGTREDRVGNETYYRFSFRNPAVRLATSETLVLHPGLWKALNIV